MQNVFNYTPPYKQPVSKNTDLSLTISCKLYAFDSLKIMCSGISLFCAVVSVAVFLHMNIIGIECHSVLDRNWFAPRKGYAKFWPFLKHVAVKLASSHQEMFSNALLLTGVGPAVVYRLSTSRFDMSRIQRCSSP